MTAGPTFEAIDPVRGITNTSSGKMGFALAQAAAEAGADVTLVAGPTTLATPVGVDAHRRAQRGARWHDAVIDARRRRTTSSSPSPRLPTTRPSRPRERKLKKRDDALTLTLKPTVDILATVAARADRRRSASASPRRATTCVAHAEEKRKRKKLPLLVANRAQDALGSDDNEVTLLDDSGAHPLPRMDKLALARRLVAEIAKRMAVPT